MKLKNLKVFKSALFLTTALTLTGCTNYKGINIDSLEIVNWFDNDEEEDSLDMQPYYEEVKPATNEAIDTDSDLEEDDDEVNYIVETDKNKYDLDDLYLLDVKKIYPNEENRYYLVKEIYRNLEVDGEHCTIARSNTANDNEKVRNNTDKNFAPYIDSYLGWLGKGGKVKKEFILDSIYSTVGTSDRRQFLTLEWFNKDSKTPGILQISDMKDKKSGFFETLDSCKLSKKSDSFKEYVKYRKLEPTPLSVLVEDDSEVVRFYYSLDEVVKLLKKAGYKNIKVDSDKVKTLKK